MSLRREGQTQDEPQIPNPMQQLVDLLRDALHNTPPPTRENLAPIPPTPIATFQEFKNLQPPTFEGNRDPTEAQNWIKEIEKVFKICKVTEDQKTEFASYLLRGEANYWWEAAEGREKRKGQRVGNDEGENNEVGNGGRARENSGITWERFKKMFFEKYVPTSVSDRMEMKFLELKQGDMTVEQYVIKFNELERFAPHLVDTERRRAKRFEQGLKPWLRDKVAVLDLDNFDQLVERATIAEETRDALFKHNQSQRENNFQKGKNGRERSRMFQESRAESHNSNIISKKRRGAEIQESTGQSGMEGECEICGKNHEGKTCSMAAIVCFRCGQPGHKANDCLKQRKRGCFNCGEEGHIAINCPQRVQTQVGESARSKSRTIPIKANTEPLRPTARTFQMIPKEVNAAQREGSQSITENAKGKGKDLVEDHE